MFPTHTPEYLAARAPFLRAFEAARKPHWDRFMAGEIDHAQYRELINDCSIEYMLAIEDVWVAHGGPKTNADGKKKLNERRNGKG